MRQEKKRVIAVASQQGEVSVTLFGVDQRSERDIESALKAALSLQNLDTKVVVKPIEVVIENGKARYDIAQTFQSEFLETNAGEIWVDPKTAKIYDRLFLFERVEESGKEFFFLRGSRSRPKRLHGISADLAPFVGRNAELNRLNEWVEQIQEDQGQVVSLTAPAGMGKSRLVAAFKERLQEMGIPYFQGGHTPNDTQLYQSFRQIFFRLKQSKLHQELFLNLSTEEEAFVSLLLQPGVPIPALTGLKEAAIRTGIFETARKIISKAGEKPIVFILEDFHWADPQTLELTQSLLAQLETLHILILVIHRPEFVPPWKNLLNFNQLDLHAFSETELKEWISLTLQIETVPLRFLKPFHKLSMGNPLFVEELMRQLIDQHVIEIEESKTGVRTLKFHETKMESIPSSLHNIIAARFDRLPLEQREALRWASLLGVRFLADELETLLRFQKFTDVPATLAALFEGNYLKERSSFPQRFHEFSHEMIFEVVRETVPDREKKRKETQLGRFLQNHYRENLSYVMDRIAEHFLQGEPQLEAFQVAIKAGEILSNTHQYERALYFYQEANKCLDRQIQI